MKIRWAKSKCNPHPMGKREKENQYITLLVKRRKKGEKDKGCNYIQYQTRQKRK